MSAGMNLRSPDCERARQTIDRLLDAEPFDTAEARELQDLDAHLVTCNDCRRCKLELETIASQLRGMRERSFPDPAVQALLDRTVRAGSEARRDSGFRWRYAAVAAAAVLALALFGFWPAGDRHAPQPTEAEMDQAAREAVMVLKIASQALRRSERAAFHDLLGQEVSGTLRRVPIDWPSSTEGSGGQRKDGS